jgi:hypothetical protein
MTGLLVVVRGIPYLGTIPLTATEVATVEAAEVVPDDDLAIA